MGAGTSPAEGVHAEAEGVHVEGGRTEGVQAAGGTNPDRSAAESESVTSERAGSSREAGEADGPAGTDGPTGADASAGTDGPTDADGSADTDGSADVDASADTDEAEVQGGGSGSTWEPSRRFSLTRDTARPEGGGRAAPGDAPAPARQWPLLTVLCTAGVGLLIVGTDPFTHAFRIGVMLMGVALLAGAVLRWVVPSVGMLAVRSRFTDLVTYGLMGTLLVLLALMAQPRPWLNVPILQDVVHFTIR
ncbi:DUF3017 domain-containing protein [Streptomyces sp. NPDC006288]|uniref:DUF3017 domain-containing protein n=1 Tax=Streptomyces sp. NPDC006288 TaxID=3156743 RepID=UPI0033A0BD32